MKNLTKEQRELRIIARGEQSNHCHVVIGDATIIKEKEKIIIEVGETGAILKHLLETSWINEGQEVWTKEHTDIPIKKGKYEYIQQIEYNPYEKIIQQVKD